MIKWYLGAFLLVLAFAAGIFVTREYFTAREHRVSSESAVVIAEKFTEVMKLVAVEGHFSELYNYEDYIGVNWFPMRKRAMVRVNATASVGYDLEGICIGLDEENRKVYISHPGNPILLAIDHDLEYYDISQGAFNIFSSSDYNNINARAKEHIAIAAVSNSTLFEKAEQQMDGILQSLSSGLTSIGWELEITPFEPAPNQVVGPELISEVNIGR